MQFKNDHYFEQQARDASLISVMMKEERREKYLAMCDKMKQ